MSEFIYEHSQCYDMFGKPLKAPMLTQREEIVRCRDCEKWDFMHQDPDGTEWGECAEFSHSCGGHFTRMNGFCYWGERK